jgi:hypothetical protein
MRFLPSVVSAKHVGEFRVYLAFSDGVEATVDFQRWLNGPVFEPLKSTRYFSQLFVEGGGVAWPNGADIAPEALYEAAIAEGAHKRLHTTAGVREKRAEYKTSARRRR